MTTLNQNQEQLALFRIIINSVIAIKIFYFVYFMFYDISTLSIISFATILIYMILRETLNKQNIALCVFIIDMEILIFTSIAIYFLGFDAGFQFLIIGMMSFTYFNLFKRQYLSILLIILQVLVYIMLYMYAINGNFDEYKEITGFLYVFNVLIIVSILMVTMRVLNASKALIYGEYIKMKNEFKRLISLDPNTGLINKNSLQAVFEAHSHMMRTSVTIIMAEIDDFANMDKDHDPGCKDFVLKEVSKTFLGNFRDNDFICRWKDGVFVIVITGIESDFAFSIIKRTKLKINSLNLNYKNKILNLTMTFGMVYCQKSWKHSVQKLIKRSNELLSSGKKSGRNCIRVDCIYN